MYLLGYLAAQSRVYLMDRDFSVIPYTLLLSVVEYKTLVLRGDMETAAEVLETIPKVGGLREQRCGWREPGGGGETEAGGASLCIRLSRQGVSTKALGLGVPRGSAAAGGRPPLL
jgi:hypothetical protein